MGLRRLFAPLLLLTAFGTVGCASSKLVATPLPATRAVVHVIAFSPGGGLISDAVGVELSGRGFSVIDGNATQGMLAQLNLNESDALRLDGLSKLRGKGVDAVLVVHAVGGYDQAPESASARLISTTSGEVLAGVNWQNGFGGERGSMADRVQRDGLTQAAAQIATALSDRVQH